MRSVFCTNPNGRDLSVQRENLSTQSDLEELHDRLTDGIESCRSVIANYKSLLSTPPDKPSLDEAGGRGGEPSVASRG